MIDTTATDHLSQTTHTVITIAAVFTAQVISRVRANIKLKKTEKNVLDGTASPDDVKAVEKKVDYLSSRVALLEEQVRKNADSLVLLSGKYVESLNVVSQRLGEQKSAIENAFPPKDKKDPLAVPVTDLPTQPLGKVILKP